jgi:hypothetical protein
LRNATIYLENFQKILRKFSENSQKSQEFSKIKWELAGILLFGTENSTTLFKMKMPIEICRLIKEYAKPTGYGKFKTGAVFKGEISLFDDIDPEPWKIEILSVSKTRKTVMLHIQVEERTFTLRKKIFTHTSNVHGGSKIRPYEKISLCHPNAMWILCIIDSIDSRFPTLSTL